MRPPYEVNSKIIGLVASVSEKIGQINAQYLDKPALQLRKRNRIRTIHASLAIEGNTLSEEQITAILDQKPVAGPKKDILEVLNAIEVYEGLEKLESTSIDSFLNAHKALMKGLVSDNGKLRKKGVGVMAGKQVSHLAPPAEQVPHLMKDLFSYLREDKEINLIKSCVFHYELQFIHPFMDGNGRMGRLWQTLILMQQYPIFEFIPFENLIHQTQSEYYKALSTSDKLGNSTPFIVYMLEVIDRSLLQMLDIRNKIMTSDERLSYYLEKVSDPFTRKDYMTVFKHLSTATASRDLKLGVDLGLLLKSGDKSKTIYQAITRT